MLKNGHEHVTEESITGTVLLVDDNPANLGVMVSCLEEYGLNVPIATSGPTALKRAKLIQPDLILLDVMMPGIDGFETCRRLRADGDTKEIPVIFMTALADSESKVKGLSCGAVDYVTKPIQQEEVLARVRTHLAIGRLTRSLKQRSTELENANAQISRLNQQLTQDNLSLRVEMDLARRIQTSILPGNVEHDELDIKAAMLPAEAVGGDYYDVLYGKDGSLWLGIGDVAGHGVTPGLIMMMAQTVKATIIRNQHVTPREVVVMMNDLLYHNVHERLGKDHFMTFTSLKYLGNGRFEHAGAHVDLMIYRKASQSCESIETTGVWLNVFPDISDDTGNAEFVLEVGDVLILYTDGLTEVKNGKNELLDIHGLTESVRTHATKETAALRDAIITDAMAWCNQIRDDDMTLVVVRRLR